MDLSELFPKTFFFAASSAVLRLRAQTPHGPVLVHLAEAPFSFGCSRVFHGVESVERVSAEISANKLSLDSSALR